MACICGSTKNNTSYQCKNCGRIFCDNCYSNFIKRATPFSQVGEAAKKCPQCGSTKKDVYLFGKFLKTYG